MQMHLTLGHSLAFLQIKFTDDLAMEGTAGHKELNPLPCVSILKSQPVEITHHTK